MQWWCGLQLGSCNQKLYQTKEDRAAVLKRHLNFLIHNLSWLTQSLGLSALEEERANGAEIEMLLSSGVKVWRWDLLAGARPSLLLTPSNLPFH